jgi:hypothetical protein
MDEQILAWLKDNKGKTFKSPRENTFGRKTYKIKIRGIDDESESVKISFVGGTQGLPLYFWMFDRALTFIETDKDRVVRLGARVKSPFDPDTVEGEIWKEPHPVPSTPYKVAPHICDLLVLAGFTEYQTTKNPKTDRTVQGIKWVSSNNLQPPSSRPSDEGLTEITDEKENFVEKYKQAIIEWTERNAERIVSGRLRYSWGNKSTLECVRERNEVSKTIVMSRIRNCGAVDIDVLDKVTMWGFNRTFPMRDAEEVLKVTKKVFNYLDERKLKKATKTLLGTKNVGISKASKILGLFDQENLCIYDSRVGNALKDLKHENRKIIPSPPGYGRDGDQGINDDAWAENYQRLIWTLELVRDYLNEKGHTYRLADVEMALFMIGKRE